MSSVPMGGNNPALSLPVQPTPAVVPADYLKQLAELSAQYEKMRQAIISNDFDQFATALVQVKQQKDFDINMVDASGLTLLQNAINRGRPEFVKLLLDDPKIDITVKTPNSNTTVLDVCLKTQVNTTIAKLLLEHIKKNKLQKHFPIQELLEDAIKIPSSQIVKLLLGLGIDVNTPLKSGTYPILAAIGRIQTKVGGATVGSYSIRNQGELIRIINAFINAGADLQMNPKNLNIEAYKESILTILCKNFRMSDWQFGELDPSIRQVIKDDWHALKTIILAAHRNDIGNQYVDSKALKERADTHQTLYTTSTLPTNNVNNATLMSIGGFEVKLEGNFSGVAGEEIIRSYNEVFMRDTTCRRELLSIVQDMLVAAGNPNPSLDDKQNIIDLVQADLSGFGQIGQQTELSQANFNNGISVIPTITTVNTHGDHAMTYLFHDDLCIRVNCGATSNPNDETTTGGITIYRITDKKSAYEVWGHVFLNSSNNPIEDKVLLNDFLKQCCEVKPLKHIPMGKQSVGNCTWRSTEAGLRAIIFLNVYRVFKKLSPLLEDACFKQAEKFSELWLNLFLMRDKQLALEDCNAPNIKKLIPASIFKQIETGATLAKQRFEGNNAAYLKESFDMDRAVVTQFDNLNKPNVIKSVANDNALNPNKQSNMNH